MPTAPDLMSLPGVTGAVERARSAIEGVHRHPANRRGWPRTAAVASVRAARSSAAIDGAPLPVDPLADSVDDPMLAGALRATAAIGELAQIWQRSPLQALARLHVLAAADLAEPAELGRPRPVPGVSRRLAAMAELVLRSPWPAPVLVAVVHGELLALSPFGTADGVVARAAARLTMITSGLDPKGLTIPETGHLRALENYRSAAAGYALGGPVVVATWIAEVCNGLVAGAREGRAIADAAADPN